MMGVEHISNLLAIDGVRVTAIADPDERSLDWAHNSVGIDATIARFGDHHQLIDSEECDAVVIASPNHTHRAILDDVLDSSLHVMVEKPLCTTTADCRAVVERAAGGPPDRVVWMGLEYRYMPPTQRLLAEVRGGTVGNVRMVAIREHRFPFLHKVGNWNRFSRNTGGTLVEKCCHFFDLMNLTTRQHPTLVYASGAQDVNHLDERYGGERPDILDNAYVVVDFDGGARGLLDLCMFAENSTNEMEIAATGDRGKVEAFIPGHRLVLTRRDRDEPSTVEFKVDPRARLLGAHHGSTFLEHLAFRDAIRSGGRPIVGAADGALAVAVGVAGERSAKERRPVELKELGF
jgi:predicted dehydrogenase